MGIISLTGTGLNIIAKPDIINRNIILQFTHENGILQFEVSHTLANVFRAHLQYSIDYPNCILAPRSRVTSEFNIPIRYTDIGDMDYSDTLVTSLQTDYLSNTFTAVVTGFSFDLDPYIEETDDGVEYIQPYYDYYNDKDTVTITFTKELIDTICGQMDAILFPYQRFGALNADIYPYIKEDQ